MLAGMVLAGCAHSGHEGDAMHANAAAAVIQAMDASSDGQVSWQENQAYFQRLFTRLDVHRNGWISEEEFSAISNDPVFKAMPLHNLQVSFAMFDRNDDHKLSRDEFEHMGDRIFTLLDRNMDGEISASDFAAGENCPPDADAHASGKGKRGNGSGVGF